MRGHEGRRIEGMERVDETGRHYRREEEEEEDGTSSSGHPRSFSDTTRTGPGQSIPRAGSS
jgi:hypothetical protein